MQNLKKTILVIALKIFLIIWGIGCIAGFVYSVFYRVHDTNVTYATVMYIKEDYCKPIASAKNTLGRSYMIRYSVNNAVYENNTQCVRQKIDAGKKIAILYEKSAPDEFVIRSEFYINTIFCIILSVILFIIAFGLKVKKEC